MRMNRVLFAIVLAIIFVPLAVSVKTFDVNAEPYGQNVKIGFNQINGIEGASELRDLGYLKAIDMGAQLEHKELRWDLINYSLTTVFEWEEIFLSRHPTLEASLALAVISGNASTMPLVFNFTTHYNNITPTTIRYNDTSILKGLQNITDYVMAIIPDLSYISFGVEINGLFETYFNFNTIEFTNTVALQDYVDLCQQMYDYMHANYPTVKVLTSFRYQRASDILCIEDLVPYFDSITDIFGLSCRVPTTEYGTLAQLTEEELIERFSLFNETTTKKFAITNIYTISDNRAGGSNIYQSLFIQYLFKVIKTFEDELEFVCWYTIFDYPPGYYTMLYGAYLEPHSTAGLLTIKGDPKRAYFTWIKEMTTAGKLVGYISNWEYAIGSIALAAIVGFVIFCYVKEGIDMKKAEEADLAKIEELELDEEKKRSKRKKKKQESEPETIEFTYDETTKEEDIIQEEDIDKEDE